MRLIDADAFKQELKENYTFYGFTELLNDFYVALDEQPTIEPKRGKWIDCGSYYKCSLCGEIEMEYEGKSNFCPNCGAKMADRKTENSSEKPNNCEENE